MNSCPATLNDKYGMVRPETPAKVQDHGRTISELEHREHIQELGMTWKRLNNEHHSPQIPITGD